MVQIDQEQIRLLEKRLRGIGVDRRTFLKVAAAAVSGPAAASLLAACGDDDDDDAPTSTPDGAAGDATEAGEEPTEAEDEPTEAEEGEPTEAEEEPTEAEEEPTEAEVPADEQIFYDQYATSDASSHDFNANLYCNGVASIWAGLTTFDADFQTIADWAESWEANEDGSVWTYHIRPDNTGFTNGDPVTAEVFAYSWKRLLTPDTAAPYASIAFDIQNAQEINLEGMDPEELGVTVVDDWTLEVQMIGPRGLFPVVASYIAMVPSHPASVEEFGPTWTDPGETGAPIISNGAFQLTEWEHDVRYTVVKNPNYWNADGVTLETVVRPIIPAQQGLLPYEVGDVDWALVPGPDLERVRADAQMSSELIRYVYPGIWFLLPQVTIAPFDQLEVRTAVSHAIDRQRIVDVTSGQGQPATSMMTPGLFGFFDDPEIADIQKFDPDLAMAALEGTEFEGGQNWPEITLSLREEQHNSQIMAEDIAAQLSEVLNMDVTINIMEANTFRDALWNLELQFIFIRWFYDYPDPNNGYFDMFYSVRDTGRRQAWSNDEFDELTIQGKEETDPEARLEIYRECEKIIQEDRGYIPTTYRVSFYTFKPWVKGLPVNRQGFVVPNGNIYVTMWNDIFIEGREA
jgi:ABC-type oligopeptide transport system substrate-binding subunit